MPSERRYQVQCPRPGTMRATPGTGTGFSLLQGRAARHTSNSPQGNHLLRSLFDPCKPSAPLSAGPASAGVPPALSTTAPTPSIAPRIHRVVLLRAGSREPVSRSNANRFTVLRDKSNQRTGFDKIRLQEAEVSNSRHCCFSEQHVERSADII